MKIVVIADSGQREEFIQGIDVPASLVWIAEPEALMKTAQAKEADACIDLLFDDTEERIKILNQLSSQIIIINAVINPLNESTSGFIRFNGWNTFLKAAVVEAAGGDNLLRQRAEQVFLSIGKKTGWVPDKIGFISPRVVSSIINEAYFTLEEAVSTREEIDTAMKLGTNYPYGPFEWSKKIGVKKVFTLLNKLAKEENRYTPSALLTREAST